MFFRILRSIVKTANNKRAEKAKSRYASAICLKIRCVFHKLFWISSRFKAFSLADCIFLKHLLIIEMNHYFYSLYKLLLLLEINIQLCCYEWMFCLSMACRPWNVQFFICLNSVWSRIYLPQPASAFSPKLGDSFYYFRVFSLVPTEFMARFSHIKYVDYQAMHSVLILDTYFYYLYLLSLLIISPLLYTCF